METGINFDEILFHPSALGNIMSGVKKGWDVDHSLTCKRELLKIFRQIKYDRYYEYFSKYTEKGKKMEEDAITLYSRFCKTLFIKNEERLTNEWFTGEPDIRHYFESLKKKKTIDTKCSWDLSTLPDLAVDPIDSDYEYQGLGYMNLDGATEHTVAYCLVNAPAGIIKKAKDDLWYRLDCPLPDDEVFIREKISIEKKMIFDMPQFKRDNPDFIIDCPIWTFDIPLEERVVEYTVPFDETKLKAVTDRIKECRQWMRNNL